MNTRTCWKSLVFAVFLMVLGGFVSATAHPPTPGNGFAPSAPAAALTLASTPVQDCSSGCTIMTCDGNVCTIWYCSGSTGCVVEGRFIRQVPEAQRQMSTPSNPPPGNKIAYVKTCQTDTLCNLYALSGSKAVLVGTFDNIDGAAERYGKLHN